MPVAAPDVDPTLLTVAEHMDELVFVWSSAGQMLWVNSTFERVTGMSVDDYAFRNEDNPFIHPDDLPQVVAALDAFEASDALVSEPIDNRFFDIWGGVHAFSSVVVRVVWEAAPALLFICKRVDAERAEARAEASHRQLVEAADDGILKLDANACVVFTNRRMHELTGLPPVRLARSRFPDLFAAEHRPDLERALVDARSAPHGATVRAPLDGSEIWLDVKLVCIHDPDLEGAVLAIARDVTETRRLEAQALYNEKQAALTLLVGGVAHDLNNILTGALANITYLESEATDRPAPPESLSEIRVACERAALMGRALLAYLGQAPGRVQRVDLDEMLEQTVSVIRPLLGATVEVDVRGVDSDATIEGDAGRLGQVVMNLLTNAAHALGERGGTIRLRSRIRDVADGEPGLRPSRPAGRYASVEVEDHGLGMSDETLARIFDPHFTTKDDGHGIGLSSASRILQEHGGAVRFRSAPGHGSTFEVLLPLAEEEAQPPAPPPVAPAVPTGRRVLVVDDEAAIRMVVERILARSGIEALLAASGAEGLALLDQGPVDGVILDAHMPGETGPEIAEQMHARQPDLPILLSSGLRAPRYDRAVGFLAKPYTAKELLAAVGALFAIAPEP